MNPSVKRLLLQSSSTELLTPIYADAALMLFISLTTLLVLKRKQKNKIHSLDPKFALIIAPYAAIIGLASANFTLGNYILPFSVSILSTAILALYITFIRDRNKAYILEAVTGLGSLLFLLTSSSIYTRLLLFPLLEIVFYGVAAFAPVYIIHRFLINEETGLLYFFPVLTHFFDASSTFVALRNGLIESQILAKSFISLLGPKGIFVMKFVVILPISLYMGRNSEEKYFEEALYMIGLYGLVLAFRNSFLILSATTTAA